jgi:nitrite reductase/ring-hydroxylating ferredoxin subunit
MPHHDLGEAPDLEPGQAVRVELAGRGVAVFRTEDGLFGLDDTCPHASGPLSQGVLRDGCVVCPWHGWRFDLRTGACAVVPGVRTRSYDVRIEDGRLLVAERNAAG